MMRLYPLFLKCTLSAMVFTAASAYSVTKEERLFGITIKQDHPKYDVITLENGFHNCNIDTDGELFVIRMLKPGDFYADVGANIGEWSSRAFSFQPNISGCCFEPIPEIMNILQSNLRGKPILFSQYALSNQAGKVTFNYYPTQPHLSSLHRRAEESELNITPTFLRLKVERLDTFCKNNQISKINIVKIDVEGNELNVILGAQGLLENRAIDVIQFEYSKMFLDSNATLKEVFTFLTYYGFSLYRLTPWGLIEIAEWRDALESYNFANYVAVLKSNYHSE